MAAEPRPKLIKLALTWALVLGVIGFGCGFFGPIALSPEANQGPLLGIFISGPLSFLLGFALGVMVWMLSLPGGMRGTVLYVAGTAVALVTLLYSTPSPKYIGDVIDAEIAGCVPPREALPAAIGNWQASIARVTWAAPRAGWKENAERLAQTDSGVVLEMRIVRQRKIYENRKPWNKGNVRPAAWRTEVETKRYYTRHAGGSCADYPAGLRAAYFPFSEREPEGTWPALALPNFLGLQMLGPVPEKYRVLPGDGG